ncbi:MAG: TatD DNase family protein, partial [Rhodothermales bacterium]
MDCKRMLIDTHTHTYLDKFDEDRDDVIARAQDAGVDVQLLPAIDVASIHAALDLARRHEGVFVMAALHPSETKDATDADFAEIERLAGEPEMVA